jgi:hypothetical protein
MVGGSLVTPASSTTKTGRHDIAEILLKVALNTKNFNIFTIYINKKVHIYYAPPPPQPSSNPD